MFLIVLIQWKIKMRIPLAHASLCGFYMHCLFHLDNSEVDFIICIRSKQSQKQKSPTYNQVLVLKTKCILVIEWIHPGPAYACDLFLGYQRSWIYALSSAQTSLCELVFPILSFRRASGSQLSHLLPLDPWKLLVEEEHVCAC